MLAHQSSPTNMQTAIAQVFTHADLLDQCEPSIRPSGLPGTDPMEDDAK